MTSPADLLKGTTPGPWHFAYAKNDPDPSWWVYFGNTLLEVPKDDAGEPYGDALTEADARLIAAAPDIARRLALLDTAIFGCKECDHPHLLSELFPLNADAEALLASSSSRSEDTPAEKREG